MTAALNAIDAARSAVRALLEGGVRDVVVAPGSRSAPLAYALAEEEGRGGLRLHVRIDERAAGFTALGLSLGSLRPVPVVTTSGTAVGELLPAVMEANHAGVELVVLSADRPEELRGTGANQTTVQPGIFGSHVRYAVDVAAGADPAEPVAVGLLAAKGIPLPESGQGADTHGLAATPSPGAAAAEPDRHRGAVGPVHINLALRDPLVPLIGDGGGPAAGLGEPVAVGSGAVPVDGNEASPAVLEVPAPLKAPKRAPVPTVETAEERRTVVVAGHGAGAYAEAFARAHRLPLLAEPSSNARFGPNAVAVYRMLLAQLGAAVERVVVFGRPTLSRPVAALLGREDVQSALFMPEPVAWFDAGRRRERLIDEPADLSLFSGLGPEGWLERWQQAGEAGAAAAAEVLAAEPGLTGLRVGAAVWRHTAGRLVLGSSNPIRDVDLLGPAATEPAAFVHANRGLAGIDGTVSTATGVALAAQEPTRVLLGDLTFLHDAGGLFLGAGEPEPALQIVVLNDGGGGIFTLLEHGKVGLEANYTAAVERLFGTPHRVDLSAVAAAYGVRYRLVEDESGLEAALREPIVGRSLLEVRTDRSRLRDLHARIAAAVSGAAAPLVPQQA
ncbi:2-succinyl-5-enolpyruvyl-6-hydroxy-3-cyclohexene-1-carboxylate synthase [Arthrobacter mangrovi]|uniref:2-succinyl-5-enolpyruvyl-6-hydroxy-3-cyclohexene-1-carboxylate synthase n=1 Tax=Arthrobacter mangrovi TaxID=2966350 RepID=A0ABQ5MUH2_9MICC|nr:thiamine pyrophosphate-binding protein [Arthrobacter mangrovi]GLB67605.1 2-succinyl-5-enolpyruvyl-6-hydroxy-3-cyclohexene- 1-carboxylate synthase [Arthrobacter mangrovi]